MGTSLESDQQASLTAGKLLARNTIWNMVGRGFPFFVALLAIPILIDGLGTERFGVMTLVWMMIGYFGLFDLGLGRALTKIVSEKIGRNEPSEVPAYVWTASAIMLLFSLVGTLVLILLAPWLAHDLLKIPPELQTETVNSIYVLSLAVPVLICAVVFVGVLASNQRFDLINYVQIPSGVFNYLGPILVLPFSRSLTAVIGAMVLTKFLALLAFIILSLRVMPALRKTVMVSKKVLKPLFQFGSWMTVANVINPFMLTLDRLLIGVLISATAVAYYATPYETMNRLLIIPLAVGGVLFPAFAMTFMNDKNRMELLFARGVKYLYLIIFPITFLIVTLAFDGLNLWLGADFADNSTKVLQLLAIGILVTSIAQVPFVLLQGAGKVDLIAKMYLVELPVYFVLALLLIKSFGINGAAVAWVLRALVDIFLLLLFSSRLLSPGSVLTSRTVYIGAGSAAAIMIGMFAPMGLLLKAAFAGVVLIVLMITAWRQILDDRERGLIRSRLRFSRGAGSPIE